MYSSSGANPTIAVWSASLPVPSTVTVTVYIIVFTTPWNRGFSTTGAPTSRGTAASAASASTIHMGNLGGRGCSFLTLTPDGFAHRLGEPRSDLLGPHAFHFPFRLCSRIHEREAREPLRDDAPGSGVHGGRARQGALRGLREQTTDGGHRHAEARGQGRREGRGWRREREGRCRVQHLHHHRHPELPREGGR